MQEITTVSSNTLRQRAGGTRPSNPHILAAILHLSSIDLENAKDHDAVLIPMPQDGSVDRNGDAVTPARHRQRIASTVAYMKRSEKIHGMRLRVIQDLDGQVWIKRAKPLPVAVS